MAMATSVQAFKIVFNFELLYDLFYKLSKCADRKRNSKKRGQRTTLYNCSGHPGPGLIFSPKLVPDFRVPLKSGHDLSAEFLSSSQHSAALDSGHAGRDVLCIRDPKTWPCFGMAWLLLDSCFLLLVPHYRDKMGHPDPVWYCGTLYTLWPLRR